MNELLKLTQKSFNLNLGSFSLPIPYIHAIAIVVLIFFLILTLAQVRKHAIHFSAKGAIFGIFFGFLLALILEGFLIIAGRTAITEILGWKNAPKPIMVALDNGRNKLIDVLGVTDEIPRSFASSNPTSTEAVEVLQSLSPDEMKKVKALICTP